MNLNQILLKIMINIDGFCMCIRFMLVSLSMYSQYINFVCVCVCYLWGHQNFVSPPLPDPGSSGDLPGDLQKIVSPQIRDLPQAYAGRYFRQKGRKSTTSRCPHNYARTLTKGPWSYRAGDLPGDYKKNVPHSPGQ